MKTRIDPLYVMAGAALLGTVAAVWLVTAEEFSPAPMEYEALRVDGFTAVPGERFTLLAEAHRKPHEHCTNGVQVDIRSVDDVITRLPVPAREINGNMTAYIIDLPEMIEPGGYGVKVRETFNCGGRPKVEESPWIVLDVGK